MYSIEFERQACKDLRRIVPKQVGQIQMKIDSLAQNPRPPECKGVKTIPGYLRIRCGDYRILYEVDDEGKLVIINRVRHRRKAYM